jgi:exocyst complex component 8
VLLTEAQRNSHAFEKLPSMPDWMADLAQKSGVGSSAQDKAEGDARWVSDFADRLTVAIALREWDHAVSLVEEGETLTLTKHN